MTFLPVVLSPLVKVWLRKVWAMQTFFFFFFLRPFYAFHSIASKDLCTILCISFTACSFSSSQYFCTFLVWYSPACLINNTTDSTHRHSIQPFVLVVYQEKKKNLRLEQLCPFSLQSAVVVCTLWLILYQGCKKLSRDSLRLVQVSRVQHHSRSSRARKEARVFAVEPHFKTRYQWTFS